MDVFVADACAPPKALPDYLLLSAINYDTVSKAGASPERFAKDYLL